MFGTKVSAKSDLDRFDAAAALAMLCAGICEKVSIYTFSDNIVRVGNEKGFELLEALRATQPSGGTALGFAVTQVNKLEQYDRIMVFTDEQSRDYVPNPRLGSVGYVFNVASYENGINHSAWTTITGFSESSIKYVQAMEAK